MRRYLDCEDMRRPIHQYGHRSSRRGPLRWELEISTVDATVSMSPVRGTIGKCGEDGGDDNASSIYLAEEFTPASSMPIAGLLMSDV